MSLLESVMDMKYSNLYRSCATKMTSTLVNGSFEMPQIPLTVLLLAAQWGQNLYERCILFFFTEKSLIYSPSFANVLKFGIVCTSI